ncbi:MAG: HAD hydrolase-like protein [Clostridiales bacterium]|nr:HAD hydrolase-like protein [Clostridiales bacterium]
MSYTCLLFDLDGTLTDSGPGIMNSAAYALEKMGYPVGDPALLRRFVGPPLNETFHTCYGVPLEEMTETIRQYRIRYNEQGGIFENRVYPGMEGCLESLRAAGKTLLVATSKPLPMAQRVLDHFGLTQYFDHVFGGTMDESGGGCYKPLIVGRAVAACGEVPLSEILMVGDREHDIFGAHENGIACAGVLWGYGSREEFAAAGAEYIVENYEDLKQIVL